MVSRAIFFLPILLSMATSNLSLLALANTTTSNLNLQLPSINIKLDRDNYSLWRSTIINALETFDLESFILNPSPPLETRILTTSDGITTTETNPEFILWRKRDRFVLLWLKSTLSEQPLSLVVRATSSHMAWTAIGKTFQAQTRARRMAMKSQLQSLTKGSLSMLEYIERKRSISDSLAENLHPISDEDLVGYILNGLDPSYGPFTTTFMMKSEDVLVDDLAGLLLQEEARLEHDHAHQPVIVTQPPVVVSQAPNSTPLLPTPTAYTINLSTSRPTSNTYQPYSAGQSLDHTFDNRRRPNIRPLCQICNKSGHEAIDCWHRANQTAYPSRRPNP